MTITKEQVAPCPFCGQQHTLKIITGAELMEEYQEYWSHSNSFAVICDFNYSSEQRGCGTTGGFRSTEQLAIEAWNTRNGAKAKLAELCGGVEMPEPEFSSWHMEEEKTLLNPTGCINAFNYPPDKSEKNKDYWESKGCWSEPLFTLTQLQTAVAAAVAKERDALRKALDECVKALTVDASGKRMYPESRIKALAMVEALEQRK